MKLRGIGAALALAVGVAGTAAANDGQTREVPSQDGSFTGEIVGTPAEDSKFAQLQIGMSMQDVQELMDRAIDRMGEAKGSAAIAERIEAFFKQPRAISRGAA